MPVFAYLAEDVGERRLDGTLIAATASEGRQLLREQGLRILSFAPAMKRPWTGWLTGYRQSRRRDCVAELARNLSMLLSAGIPLAESLEVLSRQSDRKLSAVLQAVRDRIQAGSTLADALGAFPDWFDPLFVSAVRMGELSGQLDEALTELAEHLRVDQTLRGELAIALTYPVILAMVGVGVVLFLMSYVVPQLLNVLTLSGRPLPTSTLVLKRFSDTLVAHWMPVILCAVGLALGVGLALRNPSIRRTWQVFQLHLPLLAPLIRKSVIAQFAQRMTLLLRSGIPFVEAVQTVARQSRNLVLAQELRSMAEAVESGRDIATTIDHSRIFPPVVAHLVAVGQDSGELTAMLSELQKRYETEVRLAMKRFTTILEPILIVLLAALIGFVVFACLSPIWETTRGIL